MGEFLEKAIEKLKEELEKAKDNAFAEPVISYLIKRCEEDNGFCEDVCQEHKTWEKCFKYIYEEAKKLAKGKQSCAVRDEVVYEWAEDYYRKDDKAEEEKKAKEEAERKQKEAEQKPNKTFEDTATRKYKEEKKAAMKVESEKVVNIEEKKIASKPIKSNKEIQGQMDIFSLLGV